MLTRKKRRRGRIERRLAKKQAEMSRARKRKQEVCIATPWLWVESMLSAGRGNTGRHHVCGSPITGTMAEGRGTALPLLHRHPNGL